MPILQWALLCTRVIIDQETNAASYIDAIEALGAPGFPAPLPPVCVATLWRRETEQDTLVMRVRVQDPSGQTILSFQPDSPIVLTKKRHRLNVILGGVPIQQPGEFLVVVEQQAREKPETWRQEHILPLDILRIPPSEAGRSQRAAIAAEKRR